MNDEELFESVRKWLAAKFHDSSLADVVNMVTTPLLVVLGIIGAYVYYGQLKEMRHTNDLTQQALNSGSSTLAQTLAKMQLQVDATNKLRDEAAKQTPQLIIQATASTNAANAATSAAETAKGQLATAQKQFEVSERPWISVSATMKSFGWEIARPQETTLTLTYRIEAEDVGPLPATKVYVYQEIFVLPNNSQNYREAFQIEELRFCKKSIADGPNKFQKSTNLYPTQRKDPNDPIFPDGYWQTTRTDTEMRRNEIAGNLSLIGCLVYSSPASEQPYQRGFIFPVLRKDEKEQLTYIKFNENVPLSSIVFADYSGDAFSN